MPLLPAGTSAVLLGITFGFRVELVAVAVAQLALLPADLQSQLAHFLVALLLLLHLTLDPLSLSFLISFICERFENYFMKFREIPKSSSKVDDSHCLFSSSCIFFFNFSLGLLTDGPPTVDFDTPTWRNGRQKFTSEAEGSNKNFTAAANEKKK